MEMCPSDLSLREVINVRHATAYHAMPLGNSTASGLLPKDDWTQHEFYSKLFLPNSGLL